MGKRALTEHPSSDWGKVEQFVIDRGYEPTDVSWRNYIAGILLHWEGEVEYEGESDWNTPIDNWLENFNANYRMEDFNYE